MQRSAGKLMACKVVKFLKNVALCNFLIFKSSYKFLLKLMQTKKCSNILKNIQKPGRENENKSYIVVYKRRTARLIYTG